MNQDIVLDVRNLRQDFNVKKNFTINAVNDVTFQVRKGEIFGLVGETGSGKSTLARTIMGMYQSTAGEITFKGNAISDKQTYRKHKEDIQRNMQIIFQDSAAALNPRMTVEKIISEPLEVNKIIDRKDELQKRIDELMMSVGLDLSYKSKYPSEISGGQRQRVAIARSISLNPELIIADEPVASLDVSIQAQIINLFQHLQKERGFTFLCIAHDLSIIRFISNRVGVMLHGKLMELAPTKELFENPIHPYTKALISAIPVPDPIYEKNKKILTYDKEHFKLDGEMVEVSPDHFVYL